MLAGLVAPECVAAGGSTDRDRLGRSPGLTMIHPEALHTGEDSIRAIVVKNPYGENGPHLIPADLILDRLGTMLTSETFEGKDSEFTSASVRRPYGQLGVRLPKEIQPSANARPRPQPLRRASFRSRSRASSSGCRGSPSRR